MSSSRAARIAPARTAADVSAVCELFLEYAASLGFDLAFQDFEAELRELPGEYGPPAGALFVARRGKEAVGCVGVRPFDVEGTCELKRLYDRPAERGTGTGRALAEAAIAEARRLGYQRVVLDTVPSMGAARALYRSLGFTETEPYRFNPVPGTSYMALQLVETPKPPR